MHITIGRNVCTQMRLRVAECDIRNANYTYLTSFLTFSKLKGGALYQRVILEHMNMFWQEQNVNI